MHVHEAQSIPYLCTYLFDIVLNWLFYRIETIRYSRPSGQAQILGFLACVGGAVTMSLYKGPVIFPNLLTSTRASGSTNFQDQGLDIVISEGLKKFIVEWKIDSWKFGSFCGIASSFLISIYINLQVCALVLVCYLGTVQWWGPVHTCLMHMLNAFGTWHAQQCAQYCWV